MPRKAQLIEAIVEINRSASVEWLARFDETALEKYYQHLLVTLEPRGRESYWLRPADTRAVVTRAPAA